MLGDSFLAKQRLLVVAPHPDDEAIGCAGTIARVKALGGQAYVMIASAGGITQHGRGAGGQGPEVAGADLVILLQDYSAYDLDRISRDARLVLGTRGRTEGAHIEVL